jgi:hypothetical protein
VAHGPAGAQQRRRSRSSTHGGQIQAEVDGLMEIRMLGSSG